MRPVLVWRIRGASCPSFRWLRNSRKRALPRVVVHSVSILFLLQLTPLPRYGVLQETAGFAGFPAYKRVPPLATTPPMCADTDVPANCGMNGQMTGAAVRRWGNRRNNGTASSALPRPSPALVPTGVRQTLDRLGCEYVSPATSAGGSIINAGEAEVQIHPDCSLSLFRSPGLSAKSCPHPNPSPVNERGASNASAASALRAHAILPPLPPGELPAMHRPRAHALRPSPAGRATRNASAASAPRAHAILAPLPHAGEGLG